MNTVYSFTIIYRPPKQDYTIFYNECYDYITDTLLSNNNHNFILGDFNYNFESNIHPHSTFKNLTDSLSLHQLITFPTHIAGHSLDLIFLDLIVVVSISLIVVNLTKLPIIF